MKLTVPTNWQKDLIPKIKKKDVDELYGKLTSDFLGGGRPSFLLPRVSKKYVANYIKEVHKNKLSFNYILNSTCLNNLECTKLGQKKIYSFLDWLASIKVDAVTISLPFLLRLIKKEYSQFKVVISIQAGVNSIQGAKRLEDLGADRITLLCTDVNRNFKLLREFSRNIKCELQLIANNNCLFKCPFYMYHSVTNAHASQNTYNNKNFVIDFCFVNCQFQRFKYPFNFISSPWIRPEDVHYYEEIGIDRLKLVDRAMKTEAISLIVDAYTNRYYDGNLLDLLGADPLKNLSFSKKFNFFHRFKYFFHPFYVNIFKLYKAKNSFKKRKIYIDNRKLEGFIRNFLDKDCDLVSCKECGYCESVAREVIRIDLDYQKEAINYYGQYLNSIVTSEMFRYF